MKLPESDSKWPLRQLKAGCGAVRLCDLDARGTLTVVCAPCARRGRYRVESLMRTYGPRSGLPDIRHVLAEQGECLRSTSPPRPCVAVFVRLRILPTNFNPEAYQNKARKQTPNGVRHPLPQR